MAQPFEADDLPWYRTWPGVALCGLLCPPIGLALLWFDRRRSLIAKSGATAALVASFGLLFVAASNGAPRRGPPPPPLDTEHLAAASARPAAVPAFSADIGGMAKLIARQVSAQQLAGDYASNVVSADQTYKRQQVEVSGVVLTVKRDITEHPFALLEGSDSGHLVQCTFPRGDARVASLRQGQSVKLRGRVLGLSPLGGAVQVDDCEVVW